MILTWEEVYRRLEGAPSGRLWGVPRGGAIIAGLTGRAVDSVEDADAIVDDLVDSGATRAKFNGKPFWALLDKQKENLIGTWIKMPWEQEIEKDLEETVIRQLEMVGEDPTRQGLKDTPARVVKSLRELTSGYKQIPLEILSATFDASDYDEMVVAHDIRFNSLCEHHILPFIGKATVGYIPSKMVVGISKLARLVECFSRRLQIQERLTVEIANAVQDILKPRGVGVVMQARHMCMEIRGVKNSSVMTTSCLLGYMRDRPEARSEFLKFSPPDGI